MSLADFQGGSIARAPWQVERDVEDAFEGANARWDVGHEADGTHKAFPSIEVDDDATIGGRLTTGQARLFAAEYEIAPAVSNHNLQQVNGQPIDNATIRFVTTGAAWTLTGIVPIDTDTPQLLRIINATGQTGTLAHASGSSASTNQLSTPLAEDLTLPDGLVAELLYDPSSGVWRVFGVRLPVVKSLQRGTIVIGNGVASNTATISAVTTAKSFVSHLGVYTTGSGDTFAHLALTNTTTVTATRTNTTDVTNVGYEVIEFY